MKVKIDFSNRQDKIAVDLKFKFFVKECVKKTLLFENIGFDAELSCTFSDNEEIRRINREYRGIDKATDVLSFPMIDYESGETSGDYDYTENCVLLGDIIISLEMAKKQADEYGHGFLREAGFLIVHSTLHLLGYDHMEDGEREEMFQKQEQILKGMGLVR